MQDKSWQWYRDQYRQLIEDAEDDVVEVPEEIEVLFDKNTPYWSIDKLHGIIGNEQKKKRK